MLYRGAEQRIVANHTEELDAFADGWHLGPDEPAAETVDPPVVAPEPVITEQAEPTVDDAVVPVHRPRGRLRKVAI
jgi:hypothetical protein